MKPLNTHAVRKMITQLDARLINHVETAGDIAGPDSDRIGRSIGLYVKTLKDIDAYNSAALTDAESNTDATLHTYPALQPADRAALIASIKHKMDRAKSQSGAANVFADKPDG